MTVISAVPGTAPLAIPAVGKTRPVKLPPIADHTLTNGLRVLVARRPGIPRFECRLVVPVVPGASATAAARLRVLTETALSGTPTRTSLDIAEALQGMGAGLGTYADVEQLIVGGSSLSSFRRQFIRLLGEVLQEATFPADEVAIERERVVQEIAILRSQPGVIAGDALAARLYGSHPYGQGTPDPEAVDQVRPAALRKLYDTLVSPSGSLLVLTGDLDAESTMADVEAALGGWSPRKAPAPLRAPAVTTPSSLWLVDRPGAVQTNIRLGGPALPRTDPDHPALALAVTVMGGYFTSRLNDNIREQKGYTYGAQARLEHRRLSSQLGVSADVGRDVTAASLVEIAYELGRMVSLPVTQPELDAARRYVQGTLAMGIQTQAGLTSYLATLVSAGLPVTYLRDYPAALDHVTVEQVLEAARRFLGPVQLTTALVGDAATVAPTLEALGTVEIAS